VYIRENTFVGNVVHYPPDAKTGENCLLASRVMIPIDGPVRENVGLLGSPSFEIPRTVQRDKYEGADDPQYLEQGLHRKNIRNFFGISSVLLVQAAYASITVCATYLIIWCYLQYGMPWFLAGTLAFALFTLAFFVLHAQWSLTGGRMVPQAISIYEPYFWSVEYYWKRNEVRLLQGFAGTPFKNVMSRLLGVRVGRKVFDDGCFVTEKTMCEIGDYCTLNASTAIQCHSLEEGFFKSDYVVLGKGCTLGPNAYIQYGATLEDNTLLETDGYLMKGEVLHEGTTWQGNPARPA
jgi:non-ribosomal peptide synthetase-like protein